MSAPSRTVGFSLTLLLTLSAPLARPCLGDSMMATCEGLSGLVTSTFETTGSAKFAGASVKLKNGTVVDLEARTLASSSGQVEWYTGKMNHSISQFIVSLWPEFDGKTRFLESGY